VRDGGCTLGGFGAGNVLWSCPSNMGLDLRGVVTSLATGVSRDLPAQEPWAGNGTEQRVYHYAPFALTHEHVWLVREGRLLAAAL
jgi:hypothetical protein